MRKLLHLFVGLTVFIMLVLPAAPAHALLPKSFVSGLTGSDANSCGGVDPCFSFQHAQDVTASGGMIVCLDNAVQQGVDLTINKSITIDCGTPGGSIGRGGPGSIAISGPGIVVKIRNLTIDGTFAAPGSLGIFFVSGAELVLENCLIQNFPGIAVRFSPQVPGSQLSIINTTFENNGTMPSTGGGLQVLPAAGGGAGILLDRATFSYNVTAMVLSSGSGTIGGVMKDSVVKASRSNGILTSAGTTINFMIDRSTLSGNVGAAVQSSGANSQVFLNDSTIFGNQTGVSPVSGGIVQSAKNNFIFGNGTDGTPLAAVPGYSGTGQ